MKKIRLLIVLTIVFAMGYSVSAQFKLSGEFRPRSEMTHGYKTLADSAQNPSVVTHQRTRLNFNFKNDKLSSKLVLQDVRYWGEDKQLISNDSSGTYLHEAWAEFKLMEKLSIKAGRMELVYDDHRMFGHVGWTPQARSHDLVLVKYQGGVNAHLGVAYHETPGKNNFYDGPDAYKAMQFLWLNKKDEKYEVSFLFLNNGKPQYNAEKTLQAIRYSQTVGLRPVFKTEKLTASLNVYYQMGKTASNGKLSAYNLGLDIGYKATELIKLNLGYELMSGTSQIDTTDSYTSVAHSFTPFYGTNHKFNGFMDYYYVGNGHGNVGLNDIYLKAGFKKEKLSIDLHVHYFMAAADVKDPEAFANGEYKAMSKGLGEEIDLVIGYKVMDGVAVKAGYSQMIGTETLKAVKGGRTDVMSNWAWLMLVVNPTFLDTTPKEAPGEK